MTITGGARAFGLPEVPVELLEEVVVVVWKKFLPLVPPPATAPVARKRVDPLALNALAPAPARGVVVTPAPPV